MALDIAPKRLPVPEQSAEERIKNFNDVVIGYSIEEAVAESARCLQCKNAPCIKGCPVSIDIPGFLKAIKEKDLEKSWDIISQYANLPAVCGRVCPQENSVKVFVL